MAQARGKTFRVFVSFTFGDLVSEREALQKEVFPRLKEFCMRHGARFQAIDLRWGVGAEAALDQKTMNICLGEIERCRQVTPRPNFIVLLGDRYSWCPLPPRIESAEFEELLKKVLPEDQELLLWDDDSRRVLEKLKKCLKQMLPQKNVFEYPAQWSREGVTTVHFKRLCGDVYRSLEAVIKAELEAAEARDALEREVEDHRQWGPNGRSSSPGGKR